MIEFAQADALDPAVLNRMAESLGAENLPALLDVILEATPACRDELQEAALHGDFGRIEHAAHKLKSDCWTVGATGLAAELGDLEQNARRHVLPNAPDQIAQFIRRIDLVLQQVRSERDRRGR